MNKEMFEKIAKEAFEDELRKIAAGVNLTVGAPVPKTTTLMGKSSVSGPVLRPRASRPMQVASK